MSTNTATDAAGPAAPPDSVARSAPELVSPTSVMTALKAGWLLSELVNVVQSSNGSVTKPPARESHEPGALPSQLSERTPPAVRALQFDAKMRRLKPELDYACVDALWWRRIAIGLAGLVTSPPDLSASRLNDLRMNVSGALTAASTRLGRAFLVGFDLATTSRLPATAVLDDLQELFGARAIAIQQALADLSSALPDHAGRGVSLSLAVWQHWAADPQLSRHPVKWPNASVGTTLERQGEVWLAVLSGEKQGTDMLGVRDYLRAIWALVRGVASRWWVWVALGGAVAAAAGGIYLLIAHGSGVKKVSGAVLTGLGAVGIRVASFKRMLGDVATDLEHEVWGAELDLAIADAITVPPGDWRLRVGSKAIDAPPARGMDPHYAEHARTIHVLLRRSLGKLHEPRSERGIVSRAYRLWKRGYEKTVLRSERLRAWRARRFLDDQCSYASTPGAKSIPGKANVAHELARLTLESYEYDELACAPTGRLVSRHGEPGPALVWTFHHHRVRHIALYEQYQDATTEAQKAWSPNGRPGTSLGTAGTDRGRSQSSTTGEDGSDS